jgi:biopolymer transport protein ExbD
MDIFTILLLFLLMQMGDEGMALPTSEQMNLPASTSRENPHPTVILMVTEDEILIEGKTIMSVKEATKMKGSILHPVKKELARLAEQTKYLASQNSALEFKGKITVMGDRMIPFRLLKKVMNTAAQAEFPNIALAVTKKEELG